MALTDCPMCNHPIPEREQATAKTCGRCGADLSRWIRQAVAPPPLTAGGPPADAESSAEPASESGLGRGIAGALLGALVGAGVMYGFTLATGLRFPLLGIGIGLLTGYGAKWMFKGSDNTLGIISGIIAMVSVVGTLFAIYHDFPILNIISVVVSMSVAYRVASN